MKKCPYCAEDIQDAAIVCRFCNRELADIARPTVPSPTPSGKSLYERKVILERAIQTQFRSDMRIESQSDHQAVLVFGRAPNHLLHFIIGLFTLGFWWIVWLLLAIANREHRRMITVDEQGRVITSDASRTKAPTPEAPTAPRPTHTPEEIERQRRAKHRLGTALVAIVMGAAALVMVSALLSALTGGSSGGRATALRDTTASVPNTSVRTTAQPPSVSTHQAVTLTTAWREVTSWKGNGIKETETFQTTSREWRIRWKSANEPFPNAGILQIYVYDGSGELVGLAANRQGPGEDVSYLRSRPGTHYLMINSANIDWTVTVEDRR